MVVSVAKIHGDIRYRERPAFRRTLPGPKTRRLEGDQRSEALRRK
jgi:hypothetical protein